MKKSIIALFLAMCFANTANADEAYQASVRGAEVMVSINDGEQKLYKPGDNIGLEADDLVCMHAGQGVVTISSVVEKTFKEEISKPFQCQPTPPDKGKKGWLSKAKKAVSEIGREGIPDDLSPNGVTTSLIQLSGKDYFIFENSSWHKNSRTLPLSLQQVGMKGEVIQEYKSHQRGITAFIIPKAEVEDKNGQSYAIRVVNKSGSELFKPTKFSLNIAGNDDVNGSKVLQIQLQHLSTQLKVMQEKQGSDTPEVADIYVEIGRTHSQVGNYQLAALNFERALKIHEKVFGTDHFITAQTYHNLGLAYENLGIITKAEQNKNKAIQLWKKSLEISRGSNQVVVESHEKFFYEKENHTIIDILYGTDRAANEDYKHGDSREEYFTGDRGQLQYGIAQVSIPKTHKFGEMERPGSGFLSFSKETVGEHILIQSLKDLGLEQFLELIDIKLGNVEENDILVFIHGYNVSFADAVRRTAQLSYDLEFKGVPLTYSWPSKSETEEYLTDESSVQYTVPHLVKFLTDVVENNRKNTSPGNIHIIGHSMGTRALSYAVKELSFTYDKELLFKNIIFAAPDIDKDVFEVSVFPYVKKTSERITLYANEEDVALQISASMHGGKRVGQGGDDIFIFDGLDSIDASGADPDMFSLSHSYFSQHQLIVNDMKDVIYQSLPPSKRKTLIEKTKAKIIYWALNF